MDIVDLTYEISKETRNPEDAGLLLDDFHRGEDTNTGLIQMQNFAYNLELARGRRSHIPTKPPKFDVQGDLLCEEFDAQPEQPDNAHVQGR